MPIHYKHPPAQELAALKNELGLTGKQWQNSAGLRAISTGASTPIRAILAQMLFTTMAQLELDKETLERIFEKMRQAGAEFRPVPDGERQP